jgi:hypothetical protein
MTEEQAKRRFLILNMVRLGGLIIVMLGVANVNGKLLPDFSPWLGGFLMVAGAADFFFAPMLLKRGWNDDAK